MPQTLNDIQLLAAIGALAVLADEEERHQLRISAQIGHATPELDEAASARTWLRRKLLTLPLEDRECHCTPKCETQWPEQQ